MVAAREAPPTDAAAAGVRSDRPLASRAFAALEVRPTEIGRTLRLYSALVCIACIFWLGRTARGPLFNYAPGWGSDELPLMFIFYGLFSSPVALFFGRIAGRFRRERLFVAYLALSGAINLLLYLLLCAHVSWSYPAYYVWCDLGVNLMFVQFWMMANDYHTTRDAKRLYGLIGVGAVSGMLLGGLGGNTALSILGRDHPERLIFVVLAVTALLAHLILDITRRYPKVPPPAVRRHGSAPPAPWGYVALLCCVLLATFTVAQIVDFQWQSIAKLRFDQAGFASYTALYTAAVGGIAVLFQLLATQRLLARVGVFAGMLFMPVMLLLGSSWVLLAPSVAAGAVPFITLAGASVMKFGDWGFSTTINDATYQILYFPFPSQAKASIRMIIDGAARPLGYTLGGVVLLAVRHRLPIQRDGFIALPIIALWIVLAALARRAYVKTLAATLATPATLEQDGGPPDAAELGLLEQALESAAPLRARYAAERMLASRVIDLPAVIDRLLPHQDPEVRRAALEAVASTGLPVARDRLVELASSDPFSEVRAAALTALGALDADANLELLEAQLAVSDPIVRRSALAALLRHGSLDGLLAAGGTLRRLLVSPAPAERIEAADVLRRVGKSDFYRPVARLLEDDDKQVRRAACRTAAGLAHARLIVPLLAAAARPGSRGAAAHALSSFDEEAIRPIGDALGGRSSCVYDREGRGRLASTLGRIGRPGAFASALELAEGERDDRVRYALLKSAAKLRQILAMPPLPRERIGPLLDRELTAFYELDAGREACVQELGEIGLLGDALAVWLRRARRRVLRLLALVHSPSSLALVDRSLESNDAAIRANATELLDNLLPAHDKRKILPLLAAGSGEGSAAIRLARLADVLPLRRTGARELLVRLAEGADLWLATCSFTIARQHRLHELATPAEQALASPEPLVREAAALLLLTFGERTSEIGRLADDQRGDEDAAVRRVAALAAGGAIGDATTNRGATMYTTTEKILFLKGVGLFAEVPGEDLVALAHSAEVTDVAPDEIVVKQGEIADAMYVVSRGAMRVERDGAPVAKLGAGECFGEMAVLDREPRSASVVASEASEVLRIDQEDFYEILGDHPEIAEGVLRVLTHRLRQATEAARDRRP